MALGAQASERKLRPTECLQCACLARRSPSWKGSVFRPALRVKTVELSQWSTRNTRSSLVTQTPSMVDYLLPRGSENMVSLDARVIPALSEKLWMTHWLELTHSTQGSRVNYKTRF